MPRSDQRRYARSTERSHCSTLRRGRARGQLPSSKPPRHLDGIETADQNGTAIQSRPAQTSYAKLPVVMRNPFRTLPILLLFLGLEIALVSAQSNAAPHLEKRGAATQLIVDGKPFLMLSGELHNSTSSNLDYMNQFWVNLRAAGLNSVVTPLSWELVEPKEGSFDFTLVDGLIDQARHENCLLYTS